MPENYQSRVFTFISKRTNRFKDTCAQGLRHIKVAVVWGGQILLYPIQLLAQTTKIFQPQITPPARKPVLPPVSDINIEQALELVVDAGYPVVIADRGALAVKNSEGGSLQQHPATGKVALFAHEDSSNLGSYDPDTDDWEIASYSPRRSPQVVAKKPVIQGLSSLLIDRQLVLITTENEILDILTSSQQQEIRRRIGIDLAIDWYQWHTGEILDRYTPEQLSLDGKSLTAQPLIASGQSQSPPNLFNQLQDWFKNLTAKPEASIIQISDLDTNKIAAKSPRQIAPANYSFTPQPPQIDRLFDLPQLPPIIETPPISSQSHPVLDTLSRLQPDWLKQWLNYYQDYLYIPAKNHSQIVHQPAEFELVPLADSTSSEITSNSAKTSTNQAAKRRSLIQDGSGKLSVKIDPDLEYHANWIEVDSELIGYNQSLLQKLLGWLDRLILIIENWLIKIWNMLPIGRKNSN